MSAVDSEKWLDLAVRAAQEADRAYDRSRQIDGSGWASVPEDQVRRLLRAGIREYLEAARPTYQIYPPRQAFSNR